MENLKNGVVYMKSHFRGDMSLVTRIEELLDQSTVYHQQVIQLAANNENAEASAVFFDQYQPLLLEVQDNLIQINKIATQNADLNYAKSQLNETQSTIFLILISIIAIISTILLATYMAKSLISPITEIEKAATDMSVGNLNVTVSYQSKDELGNLSENCGF